MRGTVLPVRRTGSGLKPYHFSAAFRRPRVLPVRRTGSGLKPAQVDHVAPRDVVLPVRRTGSGLKRARTPRFYAAPSSPPARGRGLKTELYRWRIERRVFDYLLTRFTKPNELFSPFASGMLSPNRRYRLGAVSADGRRLVVSCEVSVIRSKCESGLINLHRDEVARIEGGPQAALTEPLLAGMRQVTLRNRFVGIYVDGETLTSARSVGLPRRIDGDET